MGKEGSQKAWELGRQAYLHWAVGRLVSKYGAEGPSASAGGVGGGAGAAGGEADKVAQVERMMRDAQGGPADVERLVRSVQ